MKRFVSILLILAMILTSTSTAFAKPKDDKKEEKKEDRKHAVELVITNLSENQTVTALTEVDFDAVVISAKKADGIIRWEITDDSAGAGSISADGVVTPTQAGVFKVRALYFESEKKYQSWLENKVKKDNYIIGSSEWYKIVVQDAGFFIPEITLIGNPVLFVQTGTTFVDPGVTAYDSKDGDITNSVTVNGNDFTAEYPGEHYIYYEVVNSSGNYAQTSRMVLVTDLNELQAPVIKLGWVGTEIPVGSNLGGYDFVAWDYEDGDLTNQVVIGGDTVDTNTVGRYDITFDVTDSDGIAAMQRSLYVVIQDPNNPKDYIEPYLSLNGSETYNLNAGESYVEDGVFAYDNVDGDLSSQVVINSNLDENVPGTYQITYDVSDAAGNAAKQVVRTVIVTDWSEPVITLNGDPVIYLTKGQPYVELGARAIDNVDGDISDKVQITSNVDTDTPGFYSCEYNVTDSSGYSAWAGRTIIVTEPDSQVAPMIVLNGYYYTYVSVGTSYSEQGARAFDDKDGEITGNIIIGGDVVDANTEGIYYVTYDVQDSAGLSAWQTKRKVVVIDWNNPIDYDDPILTLNGDNRTELNIGDTYTEQGAFAWDNVDGDISSRIVIDSNLDVNIPGSYRIIYNVRDAAGNAADPVYRWVDVRDIIAPIITLNGDQLTYLTVGQDYIDPGATAIDNIDGDISSQVEITDRVDTSSAGMLIIYYSIADSAGNYAHTYRCVVISDGNSQFAPLIVLNGYYYTYVDVGTSYTEQGVRAFDDKDGEITGNIIIGGDVVDPNVEGIYFVTYDVQDSDGLNASQMKRKVIVIDWNNPIDYDDPILTLNGDQDYIMNAGDTYIEQGATAWDAVDGDISGNITINSNLDTNVPGHYQITYDVKDAAGNVAYIYRWVTVNGEWVAPVITLIGDPVIFLTKGQNYVEPGVTAIDNVDRDITSLVQMYGNVDTNTQGMYFLQYSVYDIIGTYGWAYRWVIVSEENQPVQPMIVLYGNYEEFVTLGTAYTEKGARAYDEKDGDITSNTIIGGDVVDANVAGVYHVTYQITDSDGLSYYTERKVVVIDWNNPFDYNAPNLYLNGEYYMETKMGEPFVEPGYSAIDDMDGDITASVMVEGNVDINTPGEYRLTYRVSDSAGNETIQIRTVFVREVHYEDARINGQEVVFLTVGESFVDEGVTVINAAGEDISSLVIVNSDVVTNTPGTYYVTYDNSHLFDGYSYDLRRIVVVSEEGAAVAPVIVLNMPTNIYVLLGAEPWTLGYRAYDDKEGDITGRVVVGGNYPDFTQLGSFVVTYDVSDLDGNQAEQKVITFTVVESYDDINW